MNVFYLFYKNITSARKFLIGVGIGIGIEKNPSDRNTNDKKMMKSYKSNTYHKNTKITKVSKKYNEFSFVHFVLRGSMEIQNVKVTFTTWL